MKFFDAHFHIIDYRFPIVPNHGYLPPEFDVQAYKKRTKHYSIAGGAIVSGSFQAFDQNYLVCALKSLGVNFVGVTQLPVHVSDDEIINLDRQGIRGLRFNLRRGSSVEVAELKNMAARVFEIAGWHIELYIESHKLNPLLQVIAQLPSVSIDHLGLSQTGFPSLLNLVAKGVKIKATGFGRVDFAVLPALKQIASINPDALMFGTDLPSTRAPRPFLDEDLQLINDNFTKDLAEKILYQNALDFYRLNHET